MGALHIYLRYIAVCAPGKKERKMNYVPNDKMSFMRIVFPCTQWHSIHTYTCVMWCSGWHMIVRSRREKELRLKRSIERALKTTDPTLSLFRAIMCAADILLTFLCAAVVCINSFFSSLMILNYFFLILRGENYP